MEQLKKLKWNLNLDRIIGVILIVPSILTTIQFFIIKLTQIYRINTSYERVDLDRAKVVDGIYVFDRSLFNDWLDYNTNFIFSSGINNMIILFCFMAIAGAYLLKKKS